MPIRATSTVVPLIFALRKRRKPMSRRLSPVTRSSISSDVGPAIWKRYAGVGSISTSHFPADLASW